MVQPYVTEGVAAVKFERAHDAMPQDKEVYMSLERFKQYSWPVTSSGLHHRGLFQSCGIACPRPVAATLRLANFEGAKPKLKATV